MTNTQHTAGRPSGRHFVICAAVAFLGPMVSVAYAGGPDEETRDRAAAKPARTPGESDKPASGGDGKKSGAAALLDGKTLRGWRIVEKDTYKKHGAVTVHQGAILLKAGTPATGVAYTGPLPRIDYEISFKAKRVGGNDFFCGLTFPVEKSYCTLILGGWGGGVTGLSNVDGYAANDNAAAGYVQFKNGTWYHVRLRVGRDKIEAWVDRRKIVDLKTEDHKFGIWFEQEPVRPLGIGTWHTAAALKDIRLRRLTPDAD